MKYKIIETVKISMIMTTILNFFICIATELRYIEFIYLLLFLGINLYMIGVKGYFKIQTYNYSLYTIRKKIVDSQRATILSINILIFFYIFKEPYFFLSKYKILILLISIIIGYSSLIFLQKIRIKLSLNFFKEIIKIFLISGIIYYFPIVCTRILFSIFLKVF
ncbi:hypothetical protein HMPREF0401_00755 [Fusobacterium animalis 11_3_2]|uniref:Uncharacterized protein n=2 Tax=Fusobacterium animalis TaxID=76859 RepID=D6BJB8_9FUSO|nr:MULTISPECIES: hypothetical protein [Fusobacterium]EFD82265.2 hypothetical protein PSAG_02301 [Fusobacterium animalis D11]EGN63021.1 hypothetical protein HMPREF0401_00755 [Fusobacterium animalis 11_3_2]